jgi:phosphatidylserine/phosphatidylglycerophosphate/cardiolipin synthase-like enzyme
MRARNSDKGVTVQVIAGTHNVLLGFDLTDEARKGCMGFSIERIDLDPPNPGRRWLPNLLRFKADANGDDVTTARAPLQRFRWGDYTVYPGKRYRYRVVPRYGTPEQLIAAGVAAEKPGGADSLGGGVTVEITTEDDAKPETMVIFNRGAAASEAYVRRFGQTDPSDSPQARAWLSRGLEEGLLAFLRRAVDKGWALHASIYEFQKPELLAGLGEAAERGAEVSVVYHARSKTKADLKDDKASLQATADARGEVLPKEVLPQVDSDSDDDDEGGGKGGGDMTRAKNEAAIAAAGLVAKGVKVSPRAAAPSSAIMHDKYVVLLQAGTPVAVWTGSTNWTEGAVYGQLNVGHAVFDADVAATYEQSFQLLLPDSSAAASKAANSKITPVPKPPARDVLKPGVTAIFSPQSKLDMLELYADVAKGATLLMVCAPFLVHEDIRKTWSEPTTTGLRYVLADKAGSLGPKGEIDVFNRTDGDVAAVATLLKNPLNDYQGKVLERAESYHHKGVHIHSKVILANPLSDDPILVTGSANFSNGSTRINDSNSLIVRGNLPVVDIYMTEFMRMFEHYLFRYKQAAADPATPLGLKDDASWSDRFYVEASVDARDRLAFSGG